MANELSPQEQAKQAKLKAMKNAIKHLEKTLKKPGIAYQMGSKPQMKEERFTTGALPLDIILGGGIPKGRIVELFGAESSGKTLISTKCIAECQKAGGVCAFVDVEHSFDPSFAAKLGVNIDELFISQPDHMTDAFNVIDEFIKAGCDFIVLDSTAALVPKEEFEGEVLKTTVGLVARGMSQFLRRITPQLANNKCSIIFINQIRDNIGVMYGNPETTPGGKALKFYSSIRIRVSRDKNFDVMENDNIVQRGIKCNVVKNKTAIPYKSCSFGVFLDGREANKDLTTDIANIACNEGYILRCKNDGTPSKIGRNWRLSYTNPDTGESDSFEIIGNKDDVADELKQHPMLKEYLLKVIKGELDKPDNTIPQEKEEEMSEDDFEQQLEEELNQTNEAEELEWADITE